MKKILIGLGVLVVLAGAVVTWWTYEFPSATWRYKITVEVETPEGLKTGSAVREIGVFTDIKIGDVGGGGAGVTGEAVVVNLGERGVLFATVGEDFGYSVMFRAFPYSKGGLTKEGMEYYSNLKNAKTSLLAIDQLPRFVMFRDLNDPLSVKLVDIHDLSQNFGEGVKIKDITIETTDEPMTWGVVDLYLPWLAEIKSNIDGTRITTFGYLANRLDVGQFKKGK
jgi:hypothetical protein